MMAISLALVPVVAAKPDPRFFEAVVVEDIEGDYLAPGNGVLDIVGVHVSEKFAYDPDRRAGDFEYVFRFQLRELTMACPARIRLDVNFKVDGDSKPPIFARIMTPSTGDAACQVLPDGGSGPVTIVRGLASVEVAVPQSSLGVASGIAGANLTAFTAQSFQLVDEGGQNRVSHDVAPHDNQNAPSNTLPTTGLKSYTSIGVFPFVTVAPVTPLERYSVNGGEVKYIFQFISHPDLSDDAIRVLFTIPEGWQLSPSQGTTGANAEGQLTGGSAGQPRDFAFTASSNGLVNEGETYDIFMTVITQSGGHVFVPTRTTISGPRISDPNYTFELLTPSGLVAEESNEIRFSVGTALGPLEGARLSIDISKPGGAHQTVDATSVGNGTYKAVYTFPAEGTYILDVYVSSLKPSPHQEFTVEVGGGSAFASGLAWLGALTALGAAFLRRRPR